MEKVVALGQAGVGGAEAAAPLQFGDHDIDELFDGVGAIDGRQSPPTWSKKASSWSATVSGVPTNWGRPTLSQ